MRSIAHAIVNSLFAVVIVSACAPVSPRTPSEQPPDGDTTTARIYAELRSRLGDERMTPTYALDVIEHSPRAYVIRPGRIRSDSLRDVGRLSRNVSISELTPGAEDIWHEASIEYRLRNYARAVELYRALVDAVPGCADCRVELARSFLGVAAQRGSDDATALMYRQRAEDELTIASSLSPNLPLGAGMYSPPMWLGRSTIRAAPRDERARAVFDIASEQHHIDELDAARRLYLQTLTLEPAFGRGYLAVGDTYFDERRFTDALPWYHQAIARDSTDALAWRALAVTLLALDDPVSAKDAAIWAVIYDYHDAESWDVLRRVGRVLGFSVTPARLAKRVEVRHERDGSVSVVVDSSMGDLAKVSWLGYAFVRAVWQYEGRFEARNEASTTYFTTFEEQLEAMASLTAVWSSEPLDSAERNVDLDRLKRIAEAGYLGEYILFEELAAHDPDIVTLLSPSALHRVKQYIERFVIRGRVI